MSSTSIALSWKKGLKLTARVVEQTLEDTDAEQNPLLKDSLDKFLGSQETGAQCQADLDRVIKFHKPRSRFHSRMGLSKS